MDYSIFEKSNLTLTSEISDDQDGQKLNEKTRQGQEHPYNDATDFDNEKINSAINSEAIILITDKAGFILYLNDNCCKNVGYQQEELIGKHTRIFKTGLHSNNFYHQLWETLLNGEIWKGESWHILII